MMKLFYILADAIKKLFLVHKIKTTNVTRFMTSRIIIIWDNVLKSELVNFLKVIFHKIYLIYFWILCPICQGASLVYVSPSHHFWFLRFRRRGGKGILRGKMCEELRPMYAAMNLIITHILETFKVPFWLMRWVPRMKRNSRVKIQRIIFLM